MWQRGKAKRRDKRREEEALLNASPLPFALEIPAFFKQQPRLAWPRLAVCSSQWLTSIHPLSSSSSYWDLDAMGTWLTAPVVWDGMGRDGTEEVLVPVPLVCLSSFCSIWSNTLTLQSPVLLFPSPSGPWQCVGPTHPSTFGVDTS